MFWGRTIGAELDSNTKAKSIQGRGGSRKLRKQDVSIRRPNNADICPAAGLDFDLGSEILSSHMIHCRKVLQEEHWNESRIMDYILNDTPRTDDDSILNGLNDTIAQDGGCGRTTRELNTLLHSTTENGRPLIQSLHEEKCRHTSGGES